MFIDFLTILVYLLHTQWIRGVCVGISSLTKETIKKLLCTEADYSNHQECRDVLTFKLFLLHLMLLFCIQLTCNGRFPVYYMDLNTYVFDVWLTVHRNSVWIKITN